MFPGNRVFYGIDVCYSGSRFLRMNKRENKLRLQCCTYNIYVIGQMQ